MKRNASLTIASLLSIVLFLFHLTDDIIHGIEPGGLANLAGGVLIAVVWLYATLMLPERRSGQVIMLFGGLFAAAIPVLHMRGAGVGGEFAKTSGAFFFVWTLLALGVAGLFSCVLAANALWTLRRQRQAALR